MKTTLLQDEIILHAINTYIESEKMLEKSKEQNDGIATDYLQSKMTSIIDRIENHFGMARNEILTIITNTKTRK